MSALQIFELNAARAARSNLEQLAGILVQDSTAPAAMRQQVAAALTEVHDVIATVEKALEPTQFMDIMVQPESEPLGAAALRAVGGLPPLPQRIPGATLS